MLAESDIVGAIHLAHAIRQAEPTGQTGQKPQSARKSEMLRLVRDGIAINPHYRKLTAIVAEQLAVSGDWANAVWIWESIAASRPHIANLWASITLAHIRLGQNSQALLALENLRRLDPDSQRVHVLEATLRALKEATPG